MIMQPEIDPIIFGLGPLQVRWYGVTYLIGFAAALFLGRARARKPQSGWTQNEVYDLIFYCALGLILGARIGYVFFYQFGRVLDDWTFLFKIWQGGMSFHGGALGVAVALYVFCRRYKKGFFQVSDFTVPLAPLGLLSGRMGNFINGELWGRVSDVPWCMVFREPAANASCVNSCCNNGKLLEDLSQKPWCVTPSQPLSSYIEGACNVACCRHPSQLYEAFFEGVVLFAILWWFSRKTRPAMAVSGAFLIGYSVFRSSVEFFRQPDAHLNFIAFDWLTMGQLLSFLMFVPGVILMLLAYRKQQNSATS